MGAYERVLRHAARFKIEVRKGPPPSYHWTRWFPSSFVSFSGDQDIGIYWPSRTIHWDVDSPELYPTGLLHELSHTLMRQKPEDVDEVESGMLAFEFFSQRRLRLATWRKFMSEYQIPASRTVWPANVSWFATTTQHRHNLIQKSLRAAVRAKILDAAGNFLFRA